MTAANFLFYNGKLTKADNLLISPNNRSFRYGDGFFETIKLVNGKIQLADQHMERLFSSLELLQFQKPTYFTAEYLKEQVLTLAKKNYHDKLARVRITIFRGDGGLYDVNNHFPHHLVQTWELEPSYNSLNENGLVLDIFRDARKVCDHYSHLKSNNYLSYAMAALWAKQKKLNDAILLNPYDRVADASIANVFIVGTNGLIKTPALTEGAVSGVMRRHILKCLCEEDMPVEETALQQEDLFGAAEIFLTNAIYGIRWVKQLGNNGYTNQLSSLLHKKFVCSLL
jgi:branched-subunit amino acid aminotransferase/4-amino-4-deoxychorismate lyase